MTARLPSGVSTSRTSRKPTPAKWSATHLRGALALLRRELARVGDRPDGDEFGELLACPWHVVGDPDAQVLRRRPVTPPVGSSEHHAFRARRLRVGQTHHAEGVHQPDEAGEERDEQRDLQGDGPGLGVDADDLVPDRRRLGDQQLRELRCCSGPLRRAPGPVPPAASPRAAARRSTSPARRT